MKSPISGKQTVTLRAFDRLFPTEEDCIAFLFPLRWPKGFICPYCLTSHPHCTPRRYLICPHCGNRSSLTMGTLMHGVKKPIREWLLAVWWFSASPFDVSAKELQRLLGLSCYQTAWSWLQKLRLAMGRADTAYCKGVVEIGCSAVAPAYERHERAEVLTAAELVLALGITGRIRMRHMPVLNPKTVALFLQETVQANSALLCADAKVMAMLGETSGRFVSPWPPDQLSRTLELNRSFATCLHSVHRGGVTLKHLQRYLDEFCFRHNASLLPDQLSVFKVLLCGVLSGSIRRYHQHVLKEGVPRQSLGGPS